MEVNRKRNVMNTLNEQPSLILIGGGGHCRAVADVAESAGGHLATIVAPTAHVSILSSVRL